ncbi:DUF4124 domain-containing protein [Hydrogenophaga sp.]|uniref:DUF4124 domain-containing protein n=1 Tax=Hydrogenophaga sp. TaxID=1904254 RepID=UPI00356318D5
MFQTPAPVSRWPALAWQSGALLLGAALSWPAAAQSGQGIYTCVDKNGRRITSDRPITACLDREQHELGSSGVVKRVLPPSYTADERARLEAERRQEEEIRARVLEEKRRERALLIRYPTQASHDKERADALFQVDEVIAAVNKREQALLEQRKGLDTELEFYQKDLSKAPAWLKRKFDDNEQQMGVQKRFLAEQAQEKQRINARFDEELVKLRELWRATAALRGR